MSDQQLIDKIVAFIRSIGLEANFESVPDDTFLPGILIRDGNIIIDRKRLKYPGDLLHEAGHLAVVPKSRRGKIGAYVGVNPGEEMAAIAWSWAALKHLDLPPEVVFHPDGYKGSSENIVENFSQQRYFGTPILQWLGMCKDPFKYYDGDDKKPMVFPQMMKWLADELPA